MIRVSHLQSTINGRNKNNPIEQCLFIVILTETQVQSRLFANECYGLVYFCQRHSDLLSTSFCSGIHYRPTHCILFWRRLRVFTNTFDSYVIVVRLDKLQTPVSRSNCQLVHYLVLVFLTENKVQSAVSVINLMAYCVFVVSVSYLHSTCFFGGGLGYQTICCLFWRKIRVNLQLLLINFIVYCFIMVRQRHVVNCILYWQAL